jgi:hypothetical protein
MCQAPDKAMRVSSVTMAVETVVTPLPDNRVRIAATIFDAAGHKLAQPVLIGALGDPLRLAVGGTGGQPRYTLDVTRLPAVPRAPQGYVDRPEECAGSVQAAHGSATIGA